ncbi:MAG: NUDIX hydrolase [Acidimicrobiia bacterium]
MSRAPRPASTICLVRDTADGLEVLMVRRTPEARFMAGAWVFPGGAVDAIDARDAARCAVACPTHVMLRWLGAAVRELVEETGIWLLESGAVVLPDRPANEDVYSAVLERDERFAGGSLQYFANWITPEPLPVRFDTRFFAATVPPGLEPIVDDLELVDARWIQPDGALERADAGGWDVAFPTRKILEFLGGFSTTAALGENIERQSDVTPIQPRLVVCDRRVEILMPDDRGFDEAAAGESDPALLSALEPIIRSGGERPPEVGPL